MFILFVKPNFGMDDERFNTDALKENFKLSTVTIADDTIIVYGETEHSVREDRPYKQILRLRSFDYRTTWPLTE